MIKVRASKPGDEQSIYDLVKALAIYEKAPDEVINTPEQIAKDLFENKICYAYVAESNNSIIGFALYSLSRMALIYAKTKLKADFFSSSGVLS